MADYFTVAEARAQESALLDATKYPDATITTMRLAVEEALERACGVAFVPRTATDERHDGPGTGIDLLLEWPRPSAVTAASVDGTALDAAGIAELIAYSDGRVYRPAGWGSTRGGVLITYTHGYAVIPGRVKRAAIQLTKRFLVATPVSDRATSIIQDGSTQFFVTAGVRGAITDVPEANAIIAQYGVNASVG